MKKYLVVGASSGIGRALAARLLGEGNQVWGVARREIPLSERNQNYFYTIMDINVKNSWAKLVRNLKSKKYYPDAVIMCAAIFETDLPKQIDLVTTRKIMETNFFSILSGVNALLPLMKKGSQMIVLSSISSQKGSGQEGVGYPASKAAISIAFESLRQKFQPKITFKTVFLGPVRTGMSPFVRHTFLSISEKKAVEAIIEAIKRNHVFSYSPNIMFFVLKLTKLISQKLYFYLLNMIDLQHKKSL